MTIDEKRNKGLGHPPRATDEPMFKTMESAAKLAGFVSSVWGILSIAGGIVAFLFSQFYQLQQVREEHAATRELISKTIIPRMDTFGEELQGFRISRDLDMQIRCLDLEERRPDLARRVCSSHLSP